MTAASQFVAGYTPMDIPEYQKKFHIYIPPAIALLILEYADRLCGLLAIERADYSRECRVIRKASADYMARWRRYMSRTEQKQFDKVTDKIRSAVNRDLFVLTLAIDNDMMRLYPLLEAHYVASYAETVNYLCYLQTALDKDAYDTLRRSLPTAKEWSVDDAIDKIDKACSAIAAKICVGLYADYTQVDKSNQIATAVAAIENRLRSIII